MCFWYDDAEHAEDEQVCGNKFIKYDFEQFQLESRSDFQNLF